MTIHDVVSEHNSTRPRANELFEFTPLGFDTRYRGHNSKFSAVSPDNKKWFIKVCGHSGTVFDINQREELCSLFGKVLGANVVSAWAIPHPGIDHLPKTLPDEVTDTVTCMEFLDGNTVQENPFVAAEIIRNNPAPVADLLALFHWLGDEDRGTMDAMQVGERIVFVDDGLCGPASRTVLRGAHPHEGAFQQHPDQLLEKCYPRKPSLVREMFDHRRIDMCPFTKPEIISRIEMLQPEKIRLIVQSVAADSPMNSNLVSEELIERQQTLRQDYSNWVDCVCDLLNIRTTTSR